MEEGPRELMRRAERYRRSADLVSDAEISAALRDLAQSYETMAEKLLSRRRGTADEE
jgi:hypothetical protein